MAETHVLNHEINISAQLDTIRAALTTARGLQGWNTPLVEGTGDQGTQWILRYSGQPEFHWRIDHNEPRDVLWTCTQGPGNAIGTSVHFTLLPAKKSRTTVRLRHEGWPHERDNFVKCNTLWGSLMHHLKKYAESGETDPAFS
jgi:Activator of Hsp90 ATPase homolog 1-like protein